MSFGDHTGHGPPPFGVDRFQHFPAVKDLQRCDQTGEFTGVQKIFIRLRSPAKILLSGEKRLGDQNPAGSDRVEKPAPAFSVEVVEHQHYIELPQVRPVRFQVDGMPVDGQSPLFRRRLAGEDPGGITIQRDDIGTQFGSGQAVASFTAGDIEYPNALAEEEVVPRQPTAGWRDEGRGRHGHG